MKGVRWKMKQIAIVYGNEENIEGINYIEGTLNEIFRDYINITRYYLVKLTENQIISADVILLNGEKLLHAIKPHVAETSNLIVLTKSINKSHLPELLRIPKGTDVLLVNDTPNSTMDTLLLFYKLGILHFNLIPYDETTPDAYKGIEFAITTGESHLVPSYINCIIDIGYRKIGFDTLMKLMHMLDLNNEAVNQKLIQYLNTVADPNMDSHTNYMESYIKNLILKELSSDSGLAFLAFDSSGNLLFENDRARQIFDQSIPDFLIGEDEKNMLVTIDHINYLMDRTSIGVAGQRMGCMVSLKEEEEIRKNELSLNRKLKEKGIYAKYHFADIISNTEIMKGCIATAKKAALSDYTILLQGESGTGKELFAQSIHNYSHRSNNPFIAINCAALPESLLESELFGYVPGSFTGAQKKGKAGLFEQAHTGTIFLDEIGDISPGLQSRLLRVLQEKQIMRIGSDKIIDIDVRIITATNRNLHKMVIDGEFREDLFYRLSVLPITLPPLRARKADILPLFRHFVGEGFHITDEQAAYLQNYDWPGNVRELENASVYLSVLGEFPSFRETGSLPDFSFQTEYAQAEDIQAESSTFSICSREQVEYHILKHIQERALNGLSAGRAEIVHYLRAEGFLLSENKIRTILMEMSMQGMLRIPRGRSGPVLTEAGIARLKELLLIMQSTHLQKAR